MSDESKPFAVRPYRNRRMANALAELARLRARVSELERDYRLADEAAHRHAVELSAERARREEAEQRVREEQATIAIMRDDLAHVRQVEMRHVCDQFSASKAEVERLAAEIRKHVACATCGQVDRGQAGEYPCPACGLPRTWDGPVPSAATPGPADAAPALRWPGKCNALEPVLGYPCAHDPGHLDRGIPHATISGRQWWPATHNAPGEENRT